jgi:glycine dehydrogenase
VILRNVFENPGWYTPYTPYQAEIAQGRLEALLNFQTMVRDLTAMDIANASLLDEGTAAAEAMTMLRRVQTKRPASADVFLVSDRVFPQTLAVLASRAEPLGITLRSCRAAEMVFDESVFGALLQYPDVDGEVIDPSPTIAAAHEAGVLVAVASDLLALTLLTPPGELGADVVLGSAQRFGVPLGYGGPHAAFFATRESYVRQAPGRIIGVSVDAHGHPAYRMALADARTAHPPREGDIEHLHRAGAAGQHRRVLRRLPRPGGPDAPSRPACTAWAVALERALRSSGPVTGEFGLLRHAPDRRRAGTRRARQGRGRSGPHQPPVPADGRHRHRL